MPTMPSPSIWINRPTPSIRRPSIFVFRCFPAKFRRRKGAVKLHTLIDLHGNIPCFIHITDGKTNDVNALDELVPEPAAFYMMDRGYVDFRRLHRFTESLAFFVIRAKRNLDYARRSRRRIDKSTGLRSDQTIVLQGPKTSLQYPVPLRRISYHDADTDKRFVFLTNNFLLPAIVMVQPELENRGVRVSD